MTEPDNSCLFRRGKVFFDDGDIVLSVTDENKCQVLYCVDTKFLARHSPVFAGMFSLPSSPGVNEEVDGVPVVHLTDNQKALEDLLQFIYNPVSLAFKRRSSDTALRCMGLLELGKKYEVESVKTFVVQHLSNEWPTTMEEWQCQQAEIARLEEMHCNTCDPAHGVDGPYLSDMFPEPASVVKLCLTYDIREPLSAAIYQLSLIKFEDDYDRWTRDKTVGSWKYYSIPGRTNTSPHTRWRRTARWSLLDGDLFMRVLIGRNTLLEYGRRLGRALKPVLECTNGTAGGDRRCKDLLKAISASAYTTKHGEPLGFFERFSQMVLEIKDSDALCEPCRKDACRVLEQNMEITWAGLSNIFSVKPI